MTTPQARPLLTTRPVDVATARRYGLDVFTPPVHTMDLRSWVRIADLWLEAPLPADAAWTVAYRMVVQDKRAVVAELRIFPTEDHPDREAGSWSGEWLGTKAQVPAGGLTTRAVRSVQLGHDVHALGSIAERLRQVDPMLLDTELGSFGAVGFTADLIRDRPAGKRGRGRPALSPRLYAEIAAEYAAAVARGSRQPIQDLADARREPVTQVRARVHKARQLGFLDTGWQGAAGGRLTPAARRLLRTKNASSKRRR